jgi:protein-tyrosine phosphatase
VIDLHSHLLPNVDDGSRSLEQSVEVLARFQAVGVTGLCLTPHLLASQAAAGPPASHDRAFAALRPAAPEGLALYRGAEIMLDRPLEARVGTERKVTLNGSRYILVEFPRLVAAQTVDHALALVVAIGLVPVLAHPERYRCCEPAAVERWRAAGALMQVDGPTLLSPRPRGNRARELVALGFADIAAADNHGDGRTLRSAWDVLADHDGEVQARLLLVDNPQAIVDDRTLQPVPPLAWRFSLLDRLRAFLDRNNPEDRL